MLSTQGMCLFPGCLSAFAMGCCCQAGKWGGCSTTPTGHRNAHRPWNGWSHSLHLGSAVGNGTPYHFAVITASPTMREVIGSALLCPSSPIPLLIPIPSPLCHRTCLACCELSTIRAPVLISQPRQGYCPVTEAAWPAGMDAPQAVGRDAWAVQELQCPPGTSVVCGPDVQRGWAHPLLRSLLRVLSDALCSDPKWTTCRTKHQSNASHQPTPMLMCRSRLGHCPKARLFGAEA